MIGNVYADVTHLHYDRSTDLSVRRSRNLSDIRVRVDGLCLLGMRGTLATSLLVGKISICLEI